MKKVLFLLLAAMMAVGAAKGTEYAGTCGAEDDGANLSWVLNTESGELSISGHGAMGKDRPWKPYSDSIISIKINKGVTSIAPYAFSRCRNLQSVQLPSTLVEIHDKAFSQSGIRAITIGSLKRFGSSVFDRCEELRSVTFGDTVKSFGRGCFNMCVNLEHIVLPKYVHHMGFYSFVVHCDKLPVTDDIRYADTYLAKAAVKDKKHYVVRKGTKWIEEFAFSDCEQMQTITLPASVIEIGTNAFRNCVSLQSVTCLAVTPPEMRMGLHSDGCFGGVDCAKVVLYVPKKSVELYKKDRYWGKFLIVPIK